jgi:hypothetical protein
MATTVPKQLYVTLKTERTHPDGTRDLLGFMSPFDNTSGFKKRQVSQLSWAYRNIPNLYHYTDATRSDRVNSGVDYHIYDIDDDGTFHFYMLTDEQGDPTPEEFGGQQYLLYRKPKRTEIDLEYLKPRTFDNESLSGFQLTKSVRRVYWGGGNVVWRVLDPRGFELEISSSNLARILDCSTISKGVIMDSCIWGRVRTTFFYRCRLMYVKQLLI